MYYHDEIVDRKELNPPQQQLENNELEIADSLVKAMSITFQPEKYRDDYHLALKKIIEAKLKGVEIKYPVEPKIEIPDLMLALKASLEAAKKKPARPEVVMA